MTTITWKVEKMECIDGGLGADKLVQKVWYTVNATETVDGETYTGQTDGFVEIKPVGETFTPYADLTEETVIQWCWDNGIDQITAEQVVADQVAKKKNPVSVVVESPWL